MHIAIIANGFQEDYTEQLLNNLAGKVDQIDFIGSTIHLKRNISKSVRFLNLRGDHNEKAPISIKLIRVMKYHLRLLGYLSTTNARVVHVQWVRFPVIEGIIFTLYMRIIGKRVIYTAHDVLPHSLDNVFNRIVFKRLYKAQNQIIVHTNYIKNRIINEFGIIPEKIHVIPHGVYERPVDPKLTRNLARTKLNLDQSMIVLLFFGIIAAYKGLDLLLESIKLLSWKDKIRILVAGKVSKEYKTLFESLVNDQQIRENLVLSVRFIDDEEIETFFKASNITALPYKEASQSGVLFMSYAYGIPVIVPSLGGFPEDILPGKTGYVFEPGSAESLAVVLGDLITNEVMMSEQNSTFIREYANDNYSWDKSCSRIVEIYSNSLTR
jgi:glycosyltransferase involved in cell wall biosynthesis